MKFTCEKLALLLMALPLGTSADEAQVLPAAADHALGRVFMSSAERHRLDQLRKLPSPAELAGPQDPAVPVTGSERKKRPLGAGYIQSSSGRPYQWINGDFRPATREQVNAVGTSSSFSITRHRKDKRRDEHAADSTTSSPASDFVSETVSDDQER